MKRLMLVAASLVLVGGFMAGCKQESDTDKAKSELGATVDKLEEDASKEVDSAKKLMDDL